MLKQAKSDETDSEGPSQPAQQRSMMSFKHRQVMRHALVTQLVKPFSRGLLFQPRQRIGAHEVTLRPERQALTGGQEVAPIAVPETQKGHGHVFADGRLDHGWL